MNDDSDLAAQWLQASGVAAQEYPRATLYVVATPIGNLADLSLRALWTLRLVDLVAAEDTRVTATLLARFGLRPPQLLALHQHNERSVIAQILARLDDGARVALVSDAGTPAISDPGQRLVAAVHGAGRRVVPLPGASSVVTALSAAGLDAGSFQFIGFLPTGAKAREAVLAQAARSGAALVLLEAPHRIEATLAALQSLLQPQRRVVLARELTKKFESINVLCASQLVAHGRAEPARGEYVILIDAEPAAATATALDAQVERWLDALAEVLPAAKAAAAAAKATGLPRQTLYLALLNRKAAAQ